MGINRITDGIYSSTKQGGIDDEENGKLFLVVYGGDVGGIDVVMFCYI